MATTDLSSFRLIDSCALYIRFTDAMMADHAANFDQLCPRENSSNRKESKLLIFSTEFLNFFSFSVPYLAITHQFFVSREIFCFYTYKYIASIYNF